ncbi:MAG: hypothetical protein AAF587_11285 [Bacteroidota bacterium]
MADISLPGLFTQGFVSLIPSQRATVNRLLQEGTIRCYSLSMDRSNLWVVLLAESRDDAEELLATFPIMDHCTYVLKELMFHDMAAHELPRISLN